MLSVSRAVLCSLPTNSSFACPHLQAEPAIMIGHFKVIPTLRNNYGLKKNELMAESLFSSAFESFGT